MTTPSIALTDLPPLTPGQDPLPNARRERFCQEYRRDPNATQAAIRAGYSAKTAETQGSRLLRNVQVAARLNWLAAGDAEAAGLDARWVLDRLQEVAVRCMEAVPVRDRRGEIIEGAWTFDAGGANRALELLGKHLRLFADKGPEEADRPRQVFIICGQRIEF
jgi:phage terminase small subunit